MTAIRSQFLYIIEYIFIYNVYINWHNAFRALGAKNRSFILRKMLSMATTGTSTLNPIRSKLTGAGAFMNFAINRTNLIVIQKSRVVVWFAPKNRYLTRTLEAYLGTFAYFSGSTDRGCD